MTVVLRYVICPSCHDAVRMSSGHDKGKLRCSHCLHKFEFSRRDIRRGPVTRDDKTGRWKEPADSEEPVVPSIPRGRSELD